MVLKGDAARLGVRARHAVCRPWTPPSFCAAGDRSSTRIAPDAARDVISSRSRTPMSWKPCAMPWRR